jgi:phage-related minor tail protein
MKEYAARTLSLSQPTTQTQVSFGMDLGLKVTIQGVYKESFAIYPPDPTAKPPSRSQH